METHAGRPSLSELVGHNIHAIIPVLNKADEMDAIEMYKLHAVESSGLWLENQQLTEILLESAGEKSSETTSVFFVPFSQVKIVLGSVDVPSFSDSILESE
jgi:hypothetical protein